MNTQANEIIARLMADYGWTRERAEAELDLEVFTDVYKDVHGIRPRWMYDAFRAMTREQRDAEFARLHDYMDSDAYKAECEANAAWIIECEAEQQRNYEAYCAVESAREEGLPVQRGMTLAQVLEVRENEALYPSAIINLEASRGWL